MMLAARSTRGWPGWEVLIILILGVYSGSILFSVWNSIARQESFIPPHTSLTKGKKEEIFFSALGALGLLACGGLLAWHQGHWWVCLLSFVLPFVICFGAFSRRYTDLYSFFCGGVYALVPIAVWMAVRGSLSWEPFILGIIALLWISGLEALTSIRTYESDKARGLHNLISAWGVKNTLSFAFLVHLIMVLLMAVFGILVFFKMAYMVAVGFIALCILLEHGIAKIRKKHWIGKAFERLSLIVSVVYLVGVICEVLFPFFNFSAK